MDHEMAVKLSCKIEANAWLFESLTVEQCAAVGDLALRYKADRINLYGHGAMHLPDGYLSGSVYKKSKSIAVYDFIMDFGVSPEGEISS